MIEIILAIAILAIVSSLSASLYHKWQKQVQLINAQDEMISALIRTQQLATAAAKGDDWGLHLESNYYVMFPGNTYDENNPDNKMWNLNGVQIMNPTSTFADGLGGYSSNVIFTKFNGQTANTGTISINTIADQNIIKTITVESSGQIN